MATPLVLFLLVVASLRLETAGEPVDLPAGCDSEADPAGSLPFLSSVGVASDTAPLDFGDATVLATVVPVQWLRLAIEYNATLSGQPPPTFEAGQAGKLIVLEVGWSDLAGATGYRTGHIPGALYFNTDDLENGYPRWRLKAVPELHAAIGAAGVSADATVVVYGRTLIAAARVWWALRYAGVGDVRILDGGIEAWTAAGYETEAVLRFPVAREMVAEAASHMLATGDYVRDRGADSDVVLADVRSADEFLGLTSGYPYIERAGRIPAAIHAGDGDDAAFVYKRRDGRLRPVSQIRRLWVRSGVVDGGGGSGNKNDTTNGRDGGGGGGGDGGGDEREVIFYCGGGWRSSLTYLYAKLMGLQRIRNYSNGWSEWSTEYLEDPGVAGQTPGWAQLPTGNPVAAGESASGVVVTDY